MKKLLIILFVISLVGCSNEKTEAIQEPEHEKIAVIDKLPDFPMPLNSFINEFNKKEDEYYSLQTLTSSNDLEFEEFNDDGALYKNLLNNGTSNLQAVFSHDKKFKRVIFDNTGELTESNASVLINVFRTLNIDENYIHDFIESEEISMDITVNGYNVSFLFDRSLEYLNVSFDGE